MTEKPHKGSQLGAVCVRVAVVCGTAIWVLYHIYDSTRPNEDKFAVVCTYKYRTSYIRRSRTCGDFFDESVDNTWRVGDEKGKLIGSLRVVNSFFFQKKCFNLAWHMRMRDGLGRTVSWMSVESEMIHWTEMNGGSSPNRSFLSWFDHHGMRWISVCG